VKHAATHTAVHAATTGCNAKNLKSESSVLQCNAVRCNKLHKVCESSGAHESEGPAYHVKILNSEFATEFTIYNKYRADF